MYVRSVIRQFLAGLIVSTSILSACLAQPSNGKCPGLPDHQKLKSVLTSVVKQGKEANSGLGNQEWAAVVNHDGIVCAVVFSGPERSVQWPGSRLIAAEKANTANALSGPPLNAFASRIYIAGVVSNTPGNLRHWIRNPHEIEQHTAMPEMGVTDEDSKDIAAYLYTLH
jgi:cytochrome c1